MFVLLCTAWLGLDQREERGGFGGQKKAHGVLPLYEEDRRCPKQFIYQKTVGHVRSFLRYIMGSSDTRHQQYHRHTVYCCHASDPKCMRRNGSYHSELGKATKFCIGWLAGIGLAATTD